MQLIKGRTPVRIIPARAGFTRPDARSSTTRGDHPRSRGVYAGTSFKTMLQRGSSPLARGLRGRNPGGRGHRGIIPARAGFTMGLPGRCALIRDHPRSRGVYDQAWDDTMDGWGSSPLARGLPRPHALGARQGRIIPARAGFTRPGRRCPDPPGDHPRSRGVYLRSPTTEPCQSGSSPLARGLHP